MLAVLGLVGGLAFLAWRLWSSNGGSGSGGGKRGGGSPWLAWSQIPPPRPLETDRKKRDEVIAQALKSSDVEGGEDWDAVVIGSGIGGLSTAALLSRVGWRVLVLEQHDQAGGCCHSFIDRGCEFDVGIHYIGKVLGNTEFRAYLDQITDGQLEWASLEKEFDHILIGTPGSHSTHPILAGKEPMRAELKRQFPQEGAAIDAFIDGIDVVRRESNKMGLPKFMPVWLSNLLIYTGLINRFTSFFRLSEMTMEEFINGLTANPELRAVMAYCFGDFGAAPAEGPWTMLAMLWAHFWSGAGYPYGGSSQIAHSIIPVIEKSGGKVRVKAPVSAISVDASGAVDGVVVAKGSSEIRIPTRLVISDAGVVNTFRRLLPPAIANGSRYPQYIEKIGPGHAAIQLFVGLDGSGAELGLKARNYWCFSEPDLSGIWKRQQKQSGEEALESDPVPVLFVSFPSAKDPSWESRFPSRSVATIVSFGPWDWFSKWDGSKFKNRGEEYNRFKAEISHAIWERILKYFPQLVGKDLFMEFGSPLTTNHYIGASKGEIYGLHHGTSRFTAQATSDLRPETDVPGLFLTGQDVMGCGFSGAVYGGLLCASALLKQNLFMDLVKIRKQRDDIAKKV